MYFLFETVKTECADSPFRKVKKEEIQDEEDMTYPINLEELFSRKKPQIFLFQV